GGGKRPSFEAVRERVEWWAEVFEIPCVAYAASLAEIGELATAEFIALGPTILADSRGPAAAVADAAARLTAETLAWRRRWRRVCPGAPPGARARGRRGARP